MFFIERTIQAVKYAFSSLINVISERIQEWKMRIEIAKEKKRYAGQLIDSEIEYILEEPDKELALRVVSYLKQEFPYGIESRLQEISVDERKELMCEIVEEAEKLFDVDSVNFEIIYPLTREELLSCGCGFYNKKENLLCLNGALLMDDNFKLVEEQIYTVFHELKHARQFAAIEAVKDFGYTEEILEAWKYNSVIYISPYENDEAYRKQALELDAFGFENYVRELFTK